MKNESIVAFIAALFLIIVLVVAFMPKSPPIERINPHSSVNNGIIIVDNRAKIDVNTADEFLLSCLPGIGEKTADMIIKYRQENGGYESVDDLLQVKGIGKSKLSGMRDRIACGLS